MVLCFELVSFKQETANNCGFVITYLPSMAGGCVQIKMEDGNKKRRILSVAKLLNNPLKGQKSSVMI